MIVFAIDIAIPILGETAISPCTLHFNLDINNLNTFLDEAEKKLDDGEFDEANKIMEKYFENKMAAGHIGPIA